MPKVSVIIPSYNHEKFLQKRLDSVFNQTYQDFEVILLDDCSQDNSPEILRSYKDHDKVTHIEINEKNSGSPFSQWQKGIEYAGGEFIWIAESDDRAELTFLQRCVEKLEKRCDLVYCRSVKIDEHDQKISDEFWADSLHPTRWKNDYTNDGKSEICSSLAYRNTIPNASACVFRKKEKLFTEELINSRYTGDWLFWVNYLKDADVAFIGEPLSYHRNHSGTTRANKDPNSLYIRLAERMRAIKSARTFCGKGRIRMGEIRKYKYLMKVISELKGDIPLSRLLKVIPAELMFYTYLFELNQLRYKKFYLLKRD